MTNLKNYNLQIASFALKEVSSVVENKDNKIDAKKYKTLVKKMPLLIQKNGLLNTLAFVYSKSNNNEHKEVIKQIIQWSKESIKTNNIENIKTWNKDYKEEEAWESYMKVVCSLEPQEYRILTQEMINLFLLIKRFSDGMIKGE